LTSPAASPSEAGVCPSAGQAAFSHVLQHSESIAPESCGICLVTAHPQPAVSPVVPGNRQRSVKTVFS